MPPALPDAWVLRIEPIVLAGHAPDWQHGITFVWFDKIIVEIKAVSKLTDEHRAQVHNYLKSTGYQLGLLVNFGHHPQVEWDRPSIGLLVDAALDNAALASA